jgi:hypothetical protein
MALAVRASAQAAASPGATSQPVSPGPPSRARAVVGGDHRAAHHLGLDGRAAEGLRLQRWGDGEVGDQIGGRHVVAVADDADRVLQAGLRRSSPPARRGSPCGPGRRRPAGTGSRRPRAFSRAAASMSRAWPFQRVRRPASSTFSRRSCRARRPRRRAARPPAPARPGPARSGQVDAARDGHHLVGVDPVLGDHVVAGVVGVGDHQVALGHHRIVPALEAGLGVVDPVIGGDERHLGGVAAHRALKAGARLRAWTRLTFSLADQVGQARGVAQHDQRVLRLHRHLAPGARRRLPAAHHAPAAAATRARPPASITAWATSIVVCSAPPVSSSGVTCSRVKSGEDGHGAAA